MQQSKQDLINQKSQAPSSSLSPLSFSASKGSTMLSVACHCLISMLALLLIASIHISIVAESAQLVGLTTASAATMVATTTIPSSPSPSSPPATLLDRQLDLDKQRRDGTTSLASAATSDGLNQTMAAAVAAGSKLMGTTKSSDEEHPVNVADDGVDDLNNTTVLVDYDQQSYRLQVATTTTVTRSPVTVTVAVAVTETVSTPSSLPSPMADPDSIGNHSKHNEKGQSSLAPREAAIGEEEFGSIGASSERRANLLPSQQPNRERRPSPGRPPTGGDNRIESIGAQLMGNQPNGTNIYQTLFKKKPYSKYWTAEQKWDDIFKRFTAVQGSIKQIFLKSLMRDAEYYADVSISPKCSDDMRFIQDYAAKSTNFRWLLHMADSTGKSEPGMLTGNMAQLGHVVQCIKVRAPLRPSNDTFDERYFENQSESLGERFRGKFCLISARPVLPEKPYLVSRFSKILNTDLLSNISYVGESSVSLKQRAKDYSVADETIHQSIDRLHLRYDQIPFESELYQYLIESRNFMYSLPKFMGVCYPSSCTKDDIRLSFQKTSDEQHMVGDVEFECEEEEKSAWDWFSTGRLVSYLVLLLVFTITTGASLIRYILVDKMGLKRRQKDDGTNLANLLSTLEILSMDKCAGILFVKTKRASPLVDEEKLENNRSTSIDALKGFLVLILIYSELMHLGCLPIPFMWSKWADALFPFYRSLSAQLFLNVSIWTEAFYTISAYLIGLKLLENNRRPAPGEHRVLNLSRMPAFASFALKRYIRLIPPMLAFILINYVWPRLSNGFVMQDQANKIMTPCDNQGWTNLLLFHNYNKLNETCLWPSHVSASFFQLHLISYPILMLLLLSLRTKFEAIGMRKLIHKLSTYSAFGLILLLAAFGCIYPAIKASQHELVVPFLADYIDYDNYKRVIEWTVLPTYNHLTSYMIGICLAYLVTRKRAMGEEKRAESFRTDATATAASYIDREGSLDSLASSSSTAAQDLNSRPTYNQTVGCLKKGPQFPHHLSSNPKLSRMLMSEEIGDYKNKSSFTNWAFGALISLLVFTVCLISLYASWFWNGFGQPMSESQNFWFMCLTKVVFNLSFAYLFYSHFATRRNSIDPWMITRFLVPIGRMSLTAFYMSWIVIWFDLLSSPHQWHPSHYFLFEKSNETIFITLILSMLVYGAFEGSIKRVQYAQRAAISSSKGARQPFEALFDARTKQDNDDDSNNEGANNDDKLLSDKLADVGGSKLESSSATGKILILDGQQKFAQYQKAINESSQDPSAGKGQQQQQYKQQHRLSIADQCKLNAELRANYSFASIGLYETAGATDELNVSQQSDPKVSQQQEQQQHQKL